MCAESIAESEANKCLRHKVIQGLKMMLPGTWKVQAPHLHFVPLNRSIYTRLYPPRRTIERDGVLLFRHGAINSAERRYGSRALCVRPPYRYHLGLVGHVVTLSVCVCRSARKAVVAGQLCVGHKLHQLGRYDWR